MSLLPDITIIVPPDDETRSHHRRVELMLRSICERQERLMIDTSKLLASAARQTTDNASLRALIQSVKDQLTQTKADLAAAIAAGDPAAIAQAQQDIDTVVAKLDADDSETQAALNANVTPAPTGDGAGAT